MSSCFIPFPESELKLIGMLLPRYSFLLFKIAETFAFLQSSGAYLNAKIVMTD